MTTPDTRRYIVRKATRGEPTELVVYDDAGEVFLGNLTGLELLLARQLLDAYATDHVEEAR